MRKIKSFSALLLILTILVSMFSFTTVANAEKLPEIVVTEEDLLLIEKLEAIGVISNEFNASDYVKRGQMAKIITKYMSVTSNTENEGSSFVDVDADNYYFNEINALQAMGVVSGGSDSKFRPNDYLTYDEALVFIINAIGHKRFADREGGYPTGYYRVAIQHGMLKGIDIKSGKNPVKLIDVYRMIEASMSAAVVVEEYYGDGSVRYTLSKTETFLSEHYGIKVYRGKVTANENTKLTSPDSDITDEQVEIDGVLYDTPGYVYGYFLGYQVDYYVRNTNDGSSELLYVEETKNANETFEIDAEDIILSKTAASSYRIYYEVEDKEKHIDFIDNVSVIYNNQSYSAYGEISRVIPNDGYITALDNNNDGIYDVLFVYDYKNALVESVDSYEEKVFVTRNINGVISKNNTLDLDLDAFDIKIINSKGEYADFSAIKPGDVLSIAESKGTNKVITVYISKKTVEGRIEAYDDIEGYAIGGVNYKMANDYLDSTALSLGLSGVFALDMNDKIVSYEYGEGGKDSQIGVVAGLHEEGGILRYEILVRIYTTDGEFIEVPLAEKVKVDYYTYDLSKQTVRDTVLQAISKNTTRDPETNAYKLSSPYVAKYTISDDNVLTSIDTGNASYTVNDEGKLDIVKDSKKALLKRSNNMMALYDNAVGNGTLHARFNDQTGIVFYAPVDEDDFYDVDKYGVDTVFKNKYNMYYQNGVTTDSSHTPIENYSAYSFNTSKLPIIDIMLIRDYGLVTNAGGTSGIGVITNITTAADKDGIITKKIYLNEDTQIVLSADGITLKDDGVQTEDNTPASLVDPSSPVLKPGYVIRYGTDKHGEADNITIVAKYNGETDTITPAFSADPNKFVTRTDIESSIDNYLIGTVKVNDYANGLIQVTAGGNDYLLFTNSTSIYAYRSEREIAVKSSTLDIRDGDKVVMRTHEDYVLGEIIIFRD